MKHSRLFIDRDAFYEDPTPAPRSMHVADHQAFGPIRRWSSEADYGVWWRGLFPSPTYRLSLVQTTSELYLHKQGTGGVQGHFAIERAHIPAGAFEVIGLFPEVREPDEWAWSNVFDKFMPDWAERCGQPDGLGWLHHELVRHNLIVPEAR